VLLNALKSPLERLVTGRSGVDFRPVM
jgi:hypothetical protein